MSKVLIPAQRRQRIRDFLEIHQIAQNTVLSEMLQVSEATIRRDLELLERQGILERTHGGAALSQRLGQEPDYAHSAQTHPDEKRAIGAVAATLIEDGDTIFINSGSTTTQVIRHIRGRAGVTVITNNVSAALEAQNADFELILIGGSFRSRASSVVGRFGTESLRQVCASKAIIGVDGLSLKYGCTTPISAEAEIARLMIERTRGPVIVVADHSKWGVVSNYEIVAVDRIHTLVSDDKLDANARAGLDARMVEVLIAPLSSAVNGPAAGYLSGSRYESLSPLTADRRPETGA
ncbi:MAG: DeoR/GlpR family DNA-binding transcription regulator [Anaerolineae bacterium]